MNKSENIDQLAGALSLLQGEVSDAHKDKKGYNYKYSDLSQILEIARPLMFKHGLSISQFPGTAHDKVTVESVLMHKSGQWMSGIIEMMVPEQKGMNLAQAAGSIITYARRYSLASIIGITQSDNDASSTIPEKKISAQQLQLINNLIGGDKILQSNFLRWSGVTKNEDLLESKYEEAIKRIEAYKRNVTTKQEN
jgi:hypothetical protein